MVLTEIASVKKLRYDYLGLMVEVKVEEKFFGEEN